MKLRTIAITPILIAALSGEGRASDVVIGTRGPTSYQLDQRAAYSQNSGSQSLTLNTIPKYWTGKESGFWAGANIPYKHTESSNGLGDVTLFGGPRGTVSAGGGNFHFLSYIGETLPTGGLMGNSRYDTRVGVHGTYLSAGRRFEADMTAEYSMTGKERPDEIFGGVLAGGGGKRLRGAAGFTGLRRKDGYTAGLRGVARLTPPRDNRFHVEFVGDAAVKAKNIRKSRSAAVFLRYNLGKL
ncbi:MAG: hypothetical protein HYT73_02325 [Candidatus Aenigmarchaeota archaeon]|nr:hypothetical protein [Candidatus Aenigmarchaeota archaeon]